MMKSLQRLDHSCDRRRVEVDEYVSADDQVEVGLTGWRRRITDEVVPAEAHQRAQSLANQVAAVGLPVTRASL